MQSQNPYAPPASAVYDMEVPASDESIEMLPISDKWKRRFKIILHAGGPKLPNLKNLPKNERSQAFGFNILAFLFGPFYYIVKGMWKRGIALFVVCALVVIAIGLILDYFGYGKLADSLRFGVSAVFAIRANIDYYKKMVLNDNGWW